MPVEIILHVCFVVMGFELGTSCFTRLYHTIRLEREGSMEGGLFDSLSGILVLVFVGIILFRILTGKGG